ncbi:MAG: hypothetical protein IPL49_21095 [Saprospirales bacterium]|nr:hypothetical protein [Saprospirales bacterium]
MKTSSFFTILLLSCLFIPTGFSQNDLLTREDATRIILQEIIVPATSNHTITAFLVKTLLQPGDIIAPFYGDLNHEMQEPAWFAWINDDPLALFAHPTRYVFIGARTGDVEIVEHAWWPKLNGESLFMSEAEMMDLELIIYSDVHLKKSK